MTTNAQATAAPVPVTVGSETFLLSPFTVGDYAELDQWIASRGFAIARAAIPKDASPDERRERMAEALSIAGELTWADSGLRLLSRLDILSHYVWVSLRKRHPTLMPAVVAEKINADPPSVLRIFEALTILAGGQNSSEGDPRKN